MRSLTFALLAVAVSGCAHPTPYTAPALGPAPAAFRENAEWKPVSPSDAVSRGHWWELFGLDTLNTLEARVDVSNETLKIATARFDESRALLRQTRSAQSPQVTFAPSVSAAKPSGNRAVSSFHETYADIFLPVDASYELDVWHRLRENVSAATAAAQASAADLESVRLSLHAEVAADYFAIAALDREGSLLDDAVQAYERAVELTRNRFEGGIASAVDVAQAEAQLEATRVQRTDNRLSRSLIEHALAVLLGESATTFVLPEQQIAAMAPPAVPGVLPSQLLERRPDIAGAERRVASAHAQVNAASAALYPLLSLSGVAGVESRSLAKLASVTSTLWSAGPAAVATLADGGRRRAVVAERQAELQAAGASYRETVLTAFREVEDQLVALRVLEDEAAIQNRALDAAQRALTLATNRYRGGVSTYLEVIAAQNVALANERITVGLTQRRLLATVQLLKAIGGDWSAVPGDAAPGDVALQH